MTDDTAFPRPPATIEDRSGRSIRILVVEDEGDWLAPLTAMYRRFDPEDRAQGIPPTGERAIRDWLDRILSAGVNVVAVHGEQPVGHATLVPDVDDPESIANPAAIRWELAIFVDRPYQRAGIGRAVLEHLLGHADDAGIERVWLTVERWNTAAISLYRSVGFEDLTAERFEREMELRLGSDR